MAWWRNLQAMSGYVYQLYTNYVKIGGYNPPSIYAFLPNKTEKTYHDFTQALLQLILNANPERILMNFEKAAVNALFATFPASQITGCYFHLYQSMLSSRKLEFVYSGNWIIQISQKNWQMEGSISFHKLHRHKQYPFGNERQWKKWFNIVVATVQRTSNFDW